MFYINNSKSSIGFWTIVGLAVYGVVVLMHFQFYDAYVWLGTEDQFGENMTSVFYFIGGALVIAASVRAFRLDQTRLAREAIPLLFGIFLIVVAGEEISWGQRLLGFETPDAIRAENVQGETTLHNLTVFHVDGGLLNQHTALNLIALFMGVLVPLANRLMGPVRGLLERLNFPVLQLSVMVWFVTGLAHGQWIAKMYPHWSNPEVKELIFSVGFFLFGIGWYFHKKHGVENLHGDH